ncbi:MAG: SDR family NAD(P)-dependent oxidoreductase [Rhodospirillales bacterium]
MRARMGIDFRLDGRVAIVTGAGRGIGAAVAAGLAAAGATVVAADIDRDRLDAMVERCAAAGLAVTPTAVDVTDPASVAALVEGTAARHGGLDVLVCSAGVTAPLTIDRTPLDVWNRVLAVNLTGTFLCCQAAAAAMRAGGRDGRPGGRILLLGSVVGHQGALMGHVAYAATKGGVHAFAKALARTLAPDRITVNVIAPGLTDTEMLRGAHPPEEIAEIAGRIPLGLGSVDDVAAAAVFLASDAGRQLTGVVLDVNGGMLMR